MERQNTEIFNEICTLDFLLEAYLEKHRTTTKQDELKVISDLIAKYFNGDRRLSTKAINDMIIQSQERKN